MPRVSTHRRNRQKIGYMQEELDRRAETIRQLWEEHWRREKEIQRMRENMGREVLRQLREEEVRKSLGRKVSGEEEVMMPKRKIRQLEVEWKAERDWLWEQ